MMQHDVNIRIALVGDSDIHRWPSSLLPVVSSSPHVGSQQSFANGVSGATLAEVLPLVEQVLEEHNPRSSNDDEHDDILFLVVCAGENDLSTSNLSLNDTLTAMKELLSLIDQSNRNNAKPKHAQQESSTTKVHCIFLGPKLEPWLAYDKDARKDYIRLSQRLHRLVTDSMETKATSTRNVSFVDCLLMFCDADSANQPGALWGGRAIPDKQYFDYDELHLSEKGYQIWKRVVEDQIQAILSTTK